MITVYREYPLSNHPNLHARVEVNPIGQLDIEIVELCEKHSSEFDHLSFESKGSAICVCGKDQLSAWQLSLTNGDGQELSLLIDKANEEYETLMRDLM